MGGGGPWEVVGRGICPYLLLRGRVCGALARFLFKKFVIGRGRFIGPSLSRLGNLPYNAAAILVLDREAKNLIYMTVTFTRQ